MKKWMLLALLLGACSEEGLVSEKTYALDGAAGTGESAAAAQCSETFYCGELRRQITNRLGSGWTTGSYCIDNPWGYRGPGGQTASARVISAPSGQRKRRVEASQRNPFDVTAYCTEVLTTEKDVDQE